MGIKKTIFTLLIIILLAGGGIFAWKYFSKNSQKNSPNSNSKILKTDPALVGKV